MPVWILVDVILELKRYGSHEVKTFGLKDKYITEKGDLNKNTLVLI